MTSRKDDRVEQLTENIDNFVSLLGKQTDEAVSSETFKQWLLFHSKFHNYSFGNTILIFSQKNNATQVAGLKTWNTLGRRVKKGEKAIWILAPIPHKRIVQVKQDDGTVVDDERRWMSFRSVNVFDVSQTEGEPLPFLNYRAEGDDKGVVEILESFAKEKGIDLQYIPQEELGSAKGMSLGGKIKVLDSLQGITRASTLTHEIAHELLHQEKSISMLQDVEHCRSIREIEAEGTAFVVLSALGFDMQNSSFYLASWLGDSKKVKDSLKNISSASKEILSCFDEKHLKKSTN